MAALPQPWSYPKVKAIADVLADTNEGLTSREIGELLHRLGMEDPSPSKSKRDRLADVFVARRNKDQSSKGTITFIETAMEPVRYFTQKEVFARRKKLLNERLSLVGVRISDEGKVGEGVVAQTLDDASRIVTSIYDELRQRKCYTWVFQYCSVEVLKKAYFYAYLEATKSIFDSLRSLTGLPGDGALLVDEALALGKSGKPKLPINSLRPQTERDEQSEFANPVKGLNSLYRNPTAHDLRFKRPIGKDELLEVPTMISMVHRRLDGTLAESGGST